MMHRRRRTRGLGSWLDAIIPDSVRGGPRPVAAKVSAATKRAAKRKATAQAKLERQLARGTDCCPVIRTKCETRTVQVEVPSTKYVKTYNYAKEKFVREKVKGTKTVDRKVRLCSVSAGSHHGEMLPKKEARQELNSLKRLLAGQNCKVRSAGDKLGGK